MGNQMEMWEGMKEYAELILDYLEHALEAGTELTVRLTPHLLLSMPCEPFLLLPRNNRRWQ